MRSPLLYSETVDFTDTLASVSKVLQNATKQTKLRFSRFPLSVSK